MLFITFVLINTIKLAQHFIDTMMIQNLAKIFHKKSEIITLILPF